MGKYRVKINDVEAEKFNGRNWAAIERWLGPHLAKADDAGNFVFDIETKQWLLVTNNSYVVRNADGAVSLYAAAEFESQWEPMPPVTRDVFTPLRHPYTATFGDGTAIRP